MSFAREYLYAEGVTPPKPRVSRLFAAKPWVSAQWESNAEGVPPVGATMLLVQPSLWACATPFRVGASIDGSTQGSAAKGRRTLGFGSATPSAYSLRTECRAAGHTRAPHLPAGPAEIPAPIRLRQAASITLIVLAFSAAVSAARGEPRDEAAQSTPATAPAESPAAPPAQTEAAPAQPPAPVPIDRQRYGVRVRVAFEPSPALAAAARQAILEQVRDGMERYVGQSWAFEVVEEDGALFAGVRALARLRADAIDRNAFPEDVQKLYLLALEARGAGFAACGREWDALTRQLGPLVRREPEYDPREIAEGLLAVIHDLFRPVGAVEQARSGPPRVRGRAGDFPTPDPAWEGVTPERVFEVFYCYLTPEKTIDRIQQVPWTYLGLADDIDRGVAPATVTSGLRASLGARRRVQTFALGINRRGSGTRLKLMTRPPSRQPLAGVEIEIPNSPLGKEKDKAGDDAGTDNEDSGAGAVPDKKSATGAAPATHTLVADRNGVVLLRAGMAPAGKPVWINVRSGQALLARVPFIPGVRSEELLELGDDSLRLETEANVALLQAELVDTVARRAVLMSLARSRANAGKWDEVTALLKEIDEMRKAPSFETELNAIRVPAIKAARAARDRTAELRIEKLCIETSELVTNYLDEQHLKEFKVEIEEIRQVTTEQAADEARFKAGGSDVSADSKDKAEAKAKPRKKKKKSAPAQPAPADKGF